MLLGQWGMDANMQDGGRRPADMLVSPAAAHSGLGWTSAVLLPVLFWALKAAPCTGAQQQAQDTLGPAGVLPRLQPQAQLCRLPTPSFWLGCAQTLSMFLPAHAQAVSQAPCSCRAAGAAQAACASLTWP